jgi:hypothetical protein
MRRMGDIHECRSGGRVAPRPHYAILPPNMCAIWAIRRRIKTHRNFRARTRSTNHIRHRIYRSIPGRRQGPVRTTSRKQFANVVVRGDCLENLEHTGRQLRSPARCSSPTAYGFLLARRYLRIRLFVELSCLSVGSVALSSSGMMRCARAFPSSTPHWSKELICQIVP